MISAGAAGDVFLTVVAQHSTEVRRRKSIMKDKMLL